MIKSAKFHLSSGRLINPFHVLLESREPVEFQRNHLQHKAPPVALKFKVTDLQLVTIKYVIIMVIK